LPQPAPDLVEVALAVVARDGRVLVAPRESGVHLEGRELREETSLLAERMEPLMVFHHAYPDRNVKLHVFVARDAVGEPGGHEGRQWSWLLLSELESLPLPPANQAILRALRWRLGDSLR
jgi:8-oxo-dGTP diphosphatase